MTEYTSPASMPQFPEPYWRDFIDLPAFQTLSEHVETEVAIVGGGIAGITTAYLLAKEGVKVAVLEAGRILNGTTGHTTAKISAQHDLIYDELISHFGQERAKMYYSSHIEALQFVENTSKELGIDCDFSRQDAYLYATTKQYADKIQKEYDAYRKLGISGELSENIPFPIDTTAALIMRDQGQYHPLKFLLGLVKEIINKGGVFYENTTATTVEEGPRPKVVTRDGHTVTCDYAVSCSHFPFYDWKGLYFTRMYAERSYILGVKMKGDYPGGMYLSVDKPVRSLRYTPMNGEQLVLISGESHKTGQGPDTMRHYEALEAFGRQILGIEELKYRWSAQDLFTLDKVPYIGHITGNSPNIFIATGFKKWGMTTGIASGLLLRDLIVKRDNPYKGLYEPSRFHADPDMKQFLMNNADVAANLIAGKLDFAARQDVYSLENDEGAVVTFNGKRAGAYKDENGMLHIVDTTCTHLGCEVNWNHGDRTWDCPCHGSRFSFDGSVVEGPAEEPLKKLQ